VRVIEVAVPAVLVQVTGRCGWWSCGDSNPDHLNVKASQHGISAQLGLSQCKFYGRFTIRGTHGEHDLGGRHGSTTDPITSLLPVGCRVGGAEVRGRQQHRESSTSCK
jgi:hypothetical protein